MKNSSNCLLLFNRAQQASSFVLNKKVQKNKQKPMNYVVVFRNNSDKERKILIRTTTTTKQQQQQPKFGKQFALSVIVLIIILLCTSINNKLIDAHQLIDNFQNEYQQQNYHKPSQLFLLSSTASQQQQQSSGSSAERPRLIPLVAAESGYSENSSVNILCTVSQGHHESLTFDWFKDGQLLSSSSSSSSNNFNFNNDGEQSMPVAPKIEKSSDHSLLRIARVQSQHSGRYTCSVKNQFGQDSSSVNLIVNVKLQWIKEPAKEVSVSVNQELKLDCLAQGEPKPTMRWEKLDSFHQQQQQQQQQSLSTMANINNNSRRQFNGNSNGINIPAAAAATTTTTTNHFADSNSKQLGITSSNNVYKSSMQQNSILVSSNRYLTIHKAKESDSGFYECIASNSHDNDLRKLVYVQVRARGGSFSRSSFSSSSSSRSSSPSSSSGKSSSSSSSSSKSSSSSLLSSSNKPFKQPAHPYLYRPHSNSHSPSSSSSSSSYSSTPHSLPLNATKLSTSKGSGFWCWITYGPNNC